MTIAVYIDSCAWNYLYEKSVDLAKELPRSQFSIYVTSEVEIELGAIPDVGSDGTDKGLLKAYIKQSLSSTPVETSYTFGFRTMEADGTPSPVQVYGGFNVGTWLSDEERNFYANSEIEKQLQSGKKTKSGLGKNQTDASLASKSLTAIVLTNERMNKTGPLKLATALGGKVIYLQDQVEPSGLRIGEYLLSIS